jgi:mono/diheme cytochrome c family protein
VKGNKTLRQWAWTAVITCSLCVVLWAAIGRPLESRAGGLLAFFGCHHGCDCASYPAGEGDIGGTWYWLRSPEEEKRVVAGLFNRYCIRCHGVDGRGVWDIPGVPDFTNVRWQESRSDAERARIILEGRGAVMPPFRGVLSLEEAYAIGRYLHTFVPGTEVSRPDLGSGKKAATAPAVPSTAEPLKTLPSLK